MHGKAVIPVYTDHHICINKGTAIAFGKDENLIIILHLEGNSICRSHVDMSLGNDHAMRSGKLA